MARRLGGSALAAEADASSRPEHGPGPSPFGPMVNVGIGAYGISSDSRATLITYALGSCVAIVAWDRTRRVGGMVHAMLPEASLSPEKARTKPCMFVDSGAALLFARLRARGCRDTDLVVKAVGGARLYESDDSYDIGRRNVLALEIVLARRGLLLAAADLRGDRSRTVRLEIGTGALLVRTNGVERLL